MQLKMRRSPRVAPCRSGDETFFGHPPAQLGRRRAGERRDAEFIPFVVGCVIRFDRDRRAQRVTGHLERRRGLGCQSLQTWVLGQHGQRFASEAKGLYQLPRAEKALDFRRGHFLSPLGAGHFRWHRLDRGNRFFLQLADDDRRRGNDRDDRRTDKQAAGAGIRTGASYPIGANVEQPPEQHRGRETEDEQHDDRGPGPGRPVQGLGYRSEYLGETPGKGDVKRKHLEHAPTGQLPEPGCYIGRSTCFVGDI